MTSNNSLTNRAVLAIFILLEFIGLYLFATHHVLQAFLVFSLPFLLVLSFISLNNPRLLIITTMVIILAFPVHRSFFIISVPSQYVTFLMSIGIVLILMQFYDELPRHRFGKYLEDKLFIAYFVMLIFSLMISIVNGDDPKAIFSMFSLQLYYLGYLLGRVYFSYEKDWNYLKYMLLFATFIAFFELVYQIPYMKFAGVARLLFLHSFTVFIAFLIAVNELAFGFEGSSRKIFLFVLYNLIAITAIVTIILSLNRTMWVIFFMSMLWLMLLWFYMMKINLRLISISIFLWLSGLVVAVIVAYLLLGNDFLTSLFDRFNTFSNIQNDISLKDRAFDLQIVKDVVLKSPIWGHGIGNTVWRFWRHSFTYFIDNDYMVLLWHLGIVGTAFFLLFWTYPLTLIYRALKVINEREKKVLLLVTLTAGMLLMINALTETIYTTRPHMLIYMVMLGMSVSIARQTVNPEDGN